VLAQFFFNVSFYNEKDLLPDEEQKVFLGDKKSNVMGELIRLIRGKKS